MDPEVVWDTPFEMLAAMREARLDSQGKSYSRPLDDDEAAKKAEALAFHKAQAEKRKEVLA